MAGKSTPIEFAGMDYPSYTALAADLGLTRAAVSWAVKYDRLDRLGLGPSPRKTYRGNGRQQPVSAHGWHWSSQLEAAVALNRSSSRVCDALQRGAFEKLVLKVLGPKPRPAGATPENLTTNTKERHP